MRYIYVLRSRRKRALGGAANVQKQLRFFAIVRAKKQQWAALGFTWYIPIFSGHLYGIPMLIFWDATDWQEVVAVGAAHAIIHIYPEVETSGNSYFIFKEFNFFSHSKKSHQFL